MSQTRSLNGQADPGTLHDLPEESPESPVSRGIHLEPAGVFVDPLRNHALSFYLDWTVRNERKLGNMIVQNGGIHRRNLDKNVDYVLASRPTKDAKYDQSIVLSDGYIEECVRNQHLLPLSRFILRSPEQPALEKQVNSTDENAKKSRKKPATNSRSANTQSRSVKQMSTKSTSSKSTFTSINSSSTNKNFTSIDKDSAPAHVDSSSSDGNSSSTDRNSIPASSNSVSTRIKAASVPSKSRPNTATNTPHKHASNNLTSDLSKSASPSGLHDSTIETQISAHKRIHAMATRGSKPQNHSNTSNGSPNSPRRSSDFHFRAQEIPANSLNDQIDKAVSPQIASPTTSQKSIHNGKYSTTQFAYSLQPYEEIVQPSISHTRGFYTGKLNTASRIATNPSTGANEPSSNTGSAAVLARDISRDSADSDMDAAQTLAGISITPQIDMDEVQSEHDVEQSDGINSDNDDNEHTTRVDFSQNAVDSDKVVDLTQEKDSNLSSNNENQSSDNENDKESGDDENDKEASDDDNDKEASQDAYQISDDEYQPSENENQSDNEKENHSRDIENQNDNNKTLHSSSSHEKISATNPLAGSSNKPDENIVEEEDASQVQPSEPARKRTRKQQEPIKEVSEADKPAIDQHVVILSKPQVSMTRRRRQAFSSTEDYIILNAMSNTYCHVLSFQEFCDVLCEILAHTSRSLRNHIKELVKSPLRREAAAPQGETDKVNRVLRQFDEICRREYQRKMIRESARLKDMYPFTHPKPNLKESKWVFFYSLDNIALKFDWSFGKSAETGQMDLDERLEALEREIQVEKNQNLSQTRSLNANANETSPRQITAVASVPLHGDKLEELVIPAPEESTDTTEASVLNKSLSRRPLPHSCVPATPSNSKSVLSGPIAPITPRRAGVTIAAKTEKTAKTKSRKAKPANEGSNREDSDDEGMFRDDVTTEVLAQEPEVGDISTVEQQQQPNLKTVALQYKRVAESPGETHQVERRPLKKFKRIPSPQLGHSDTGAVSEGEVGAYSTPPEIDLPIEPSHTDGDGSIPSFQLRHSPINNDMQEEGYNSDSVVGKDASEDSPSRNGVIPGSEEIETSDIEDDGAYQGGNGEEEEGGNGEEEEGGISEEEEGGISEEEQGEITEDLDFRIAASLNEDLSEAPSEEEVIPISPNVLLNETPFIAQESKAIAGQTPSVLNLDVEEAKDSSDSPSEAARRRSAPLIRRLSSLISENAELRPKRRHALSSPFMYGGANDSMNKMRRAAVSRTRHSDTTFLRRRKFSPPRNVPDLNEDPAVRELYDRMKSAPGGDTLAELMSKLIRLLPNANKLDFLEALYATTFDFACAVDILFSFQDGMPVPEKRGIWTEEDDQVLLHNSGGPMGFVMLGEKHGLENVIKRETFLREMLKDQ